MKLIPLDYAVRNLGRSPSRLVGILVGNVLVVLLVLAAAAFVEGMRNSLRGSVDEGNVMLLGVGSEESIERSEIPASTPGLVAASIPGIRTEGGAIFVSPEILVALMVKSDPASDAEFRAILRGITPAAFLVHPRVEVVEGRPPVAGADEIMVGGLAGSKLGLPATALALGSFLHIDGRPWKIVGRHAAPGTVMEAELWIPLEDIKILTRRETISCVVLTLDDAELADIDVFTKQRPDLELTAITEEEYYASLTRFYRPVRIMIWTTALLMALAGVLGGLNTMYAAFASRIREIGMLQSLGFPRYSIAISLVQESLLSACTGVLIASFLAWIFLDGISIRFSMGVFQLQISSAVLAQGLTAGLLLGILGAIPPAWRCLRIPINLALKSN